MNTYRFTAIRATPLKYFAVLPECNQQFIDSPCGAFTLHHLAWFNTFLKIEEPRTQKQDPGHNGRERNGEQY